MTQTTPRGPQREKQDARAGELFSLRRLQEFVKGVAEQADFIPSPILDGIDHLEARAFGNHGDSSLQDRAKFRRPVNLTKSCALGRAGCQAARNPREAPAPVRQIS